MKRLIALSLVAFAHSAFAGATYGTSDYNNIERAVSAVPQPDQAQLDPASPDIAAGEETESAAAGDGTPSDGESAAADGDSESPADIHL